MQLPSWLRILWWLSLSLLLSAFLYSRHAALFAGTASLLDLVAFIVWIALLLAPLFSEVSFLGLTIKQQLNDLKQHVASEVASIKTTLDVKNTLNQQITIPRLSPIPSCQSWKLGFEMR
jgi:ABC-type transport system involved in multi-copper enzyme maturation permease subunit